MVNFRMVTMRTAFAFSLAVGIAGCNGLQSVAPSGGALPGASSSSSEMAGPRPLSGSSSQYIKHVVIVLQENRSFDNFFATFPGADGTTYGCMEPTTRTPSAHHLSSSSCPVGDQVVPLKDGNLDISSLDHDHFAFKKEWDLGKMDGFDRVDREIHHNDRVPAGDYAYRYVDPSQIKPYWDIAKEYVLADHMFTTQSSSSFTAHQDFIAGGTPAGRKGKDNIIDFPVPPSWGCNAAPGTTTNLITPAGKELRAIGPYPCFTYKTIRDLLDGAGVSWLYFTKPSNGAVWNAFDAIKAVREGPEWSTNIIIPETEVFNYIDNATLPAVSYVIPDARTSDHPSIKNDQGPEWVASVVNAVGESAYWPSTVVIVVWDEWGGNYDHVPPPQLDGQGLGARVPMLIVSAYDKETSQSQPGYISHTQYEDGSLLKFIEDNWDLGSLGTSDVRANSIVDCFDFTQQPRQFVPITTPTPFSKSYWEHYKPSSAPIDDY